MLEIDVGQIVLCETKILYSFHHYSLLDYVQQFPGHGL